MKAAGTSGPAEAGLGDKIIFACDAGMGSSAMGATRFRNRIKLDRPDLIVEHASVDEVPADAKIVVVQANLADRARKSAPNAQFVVINNFLTDPNLDALYNNLVAAAAAAGVGETDVDVVTQKIESGSQPAIAIDREGIKLGCPSISKEQAIRASGELLMTHDAVDASYVDAMLEREKIQSVYMGLGVAIPHGTNDAKDSVKKTCVTLHQYPDGVQWGDEKAYLVFGIAGAGGEHLAVLANVARALEDEDVVQKMYTTNDVDWLLQILS
jgi:PTS system mannitol-specific IIC component